ncbi:ATP-dependent DNA helicase RecG [Herbaspirillum sp. Sphag1AN]|uniref:ATP-dependent DNA helicase RecG n=1 Tax=unclassified Herbaspirillum TaxID=2624150 RepID=UPI0016222E57|nr:MULTISPECIES: ATP-dependent DNA helicase RecG [unclassified Herbaspirillum]MBB3214556.1 ATP-dependent DNA helicase RecG [Herbaspirillum sp. Sphag1AN]MBB3247702.1 ATP-dependent DNA helicase RecG [Herbaspirillum sp. Sphag64]
MPAQTQKAATQRARTKPADTSTPALSAAQKSARKLAKLGLRTDMDLALHLPMRYEDETSIMSIHEASLRGTQMVQVEGVISISDIQYRPRRQLVVTMQDDSGQLVLRFLNFYGNQAKQLAEGVRIRVRGELRHGFFGAEMVHPNYKVVLEGAPLPTALTPVYPAGEGLSQAYLRKAIATALSRLDWRDTLPSENLTELKLSSFESAVRLLHNPPVDVDEYALTERSHPAWIRMKFDELLAQQLSLKRAQAARRARTACALPHQGTISQAFLQQLPFQLTAAQQRVLEEIRHDLRESFPMQRLLQGDVGSGKTVVAALAAAQAIDSGFQAVLMAPTEILAEQHFRKIAAWMAPLGVQVAWLTGSLKKKEKAAANALIESGQARLVVGTHALIQDSVQFQKLGLVIVDEQHRFGVGQRLALRNKALDVSDGHESGGIPTGTDGTVPHQLMMSATPIPRTLAMTYYADLEVSVIDELPPGRTPIVTRTVDQNRREEVIARVHAAAQEGRQIYWVCPLIEESEALQLQTATDTCAMLTEALPELQIGLVHGRLKPAEKQAVMDAFSAGKIQVLVATTVIEVGVDVPNASLMVIEHAERFGLSQLHQLRGRVGRGAAASACILLYQSPLGGTAKQRLMTMRETADGFEIARRDLEIRGPGEFLGARQSGEAMLRFADLATDQWLVEKARDLAQRLLHNNLEVVDRHLERWLGGKEDFLKV